MLSYARNKEPSLGRPIRHFRILNMVGVSEIYKKFGRIQRKRLKLQSNVNPVRPANNFKKEK